MLCAPRSARALIVLAAAQIADWFSDQSILANHAIIMAAVNATLLVAAAQCGALRAWRNDSAGALLGAAAPGIRLETLAIYFWATFHKLNTDFLSIEHGCVKFLATDARSQPWPMSFLPGGPGWIEAAIHGTLVVELLIPTLLSFRTTRGTGILLGVCFHSFLSSGPRNGFFAFAVVIFPLLWFFASEEAMERLRTIFRRIAGSRFDISAATLVRFAGLAGIAAATLASNRLQINRTFPAWMAYDLLVLAWALAEVRRGIAATGERRPGIFRCTHPALLVMPMVVFINGACPYLGLKTETSFAMYSNLRTEGGRSNHLLVPAHWAPFPFQNDLVEVVDSSNSGLREIARSGMLLTWFDLRRRAWMNPAMSISFVRGDTTVVVDHVRKHPELVPRVSWWAGRLMPFRPVEKAGPRGSDH